MANPYVRAAANNLLQAAADKRYEEHEIQRQIDAMRRQLDDQRRATDTQLHDDKDRLAHEPHGMNAAHVKQHMNDLQKGLQKTLHTGKEKLEELARYASSLESQARSLEGESRRLQLRA